MSDSVLAQQIAENNRQLQKDVDNLSETNEGLITDLAAYKALGTPEAIREQLNAASASGQAQMDVVESYQNITESFGSEEEITENMSRLARFEAEHGSLSQVEEALGAATAKLAELVKFEEAHGTLEAVAESQIAIAAQLPAIQEARTLATQAKAFIAERGSFEQVSEALEVAGEHLGAIAEAKQDEELVAVAESYGKTVPELKAIMEGFDISADQIDEKFAILGFAKTESAIEENNGKKEDEDDKEDDDKSEKDDDKVEERYAPGKRFNNMLSGKQFTDLSESKKDSNVVEEIAESKNAAPGSRFERMLK